MHLATRKAWASSWRDVVPGAPWEAHRANITLREVSLRFFSLKGEMLRFFPGIQMG